jgi:uncharacterized protein YukE
MANVPANAVPIRRPKIFVPPEAEWVARQYSWAADEAARLATTIRSIQSDLDSSWEGNAKGTYDESYSHIAGDLETAAEILRQNACDIASITVTIYETVYLINGIYIAE